MARTASALVMGLFLAAGIAAGAAQPPPPTKPEAKPKVTKTEARPTKSLEGKETYASYCAACHGKDAKGNGPAAPALKVPPPDLTKIAQRHNGTFSAADVEATIRGTNRSIDAHGSEDMPIWGPVFSSMTDNRDVTTLRVRNLVRYLETLQDK